MLVAIFGWILKLASGPLVDKTLGYLERKADTETERERIRTMATIEQVKAATEETRILADLNKAKLQFPWFWVLISLFVVPLALWWIAVIADSIFLFPFDVADLPTPEMRFWAGDMIRWLFYVGTGTGALKVLVSK